MFLLIDKGKDTFLMPYEERFILFTKFEDCLAEAKARGYGDGGWGFMSTKPPKLGLMNHYSCGEIDIAFMRVEPR